MLNAIEEEKAQIYYDYFLCHCSARLILQKMRANQYDLRKMDQYVVIGVEGQYLAFIIPELVRILVGEKAIPMEEAIEIVRSTCGYGTYDDMILAVETCPRDYVEKLVPQFIEKIRNVKMKKEVQ